MLKIALIYMYIFIILTSIYTFIVCYFGTHLLKLLQFF